MSNTSFCPPIAQAQKALHHRETTPSKLVATSLARIKDTEPKLQATISVLEDYALEQAQKLDALVGSDASRNMPLLGIPIAVKDNFCMQGAKTTCASRMLESFTPSYNATLIDKLINAGAIIVAKSNMDEFAMGSTTESSAVHPTANPWDISRVPGGSSGGSAASVAARQTCASIGSDSGGSIRQPAAFCGCVGMKPTYGRISRYGAIAYASSFDQPGPLTQTVEDNAILLSAIAGYDPKDATSSQIDVPNFCAGLRTELQGLTIGLPKELWEQELDDDVAKASQHAIQIAKDLGATIVEISLPHLVYSAAAYAILSCAEGSTNMARFDGVRFGQRKGGEADLITMYTKSRSESFGDEVKRRILLGTYMLSGENYTKYFTKAAQIRRSIANEYTALFATNCDAIFAPVAPTPAWELGKRANDPLVSYQDIYTVSANLAGLPALALPIGLGSLSKLPIGMQIIGNAFAESTLFGIGNALEQALPPLGMPTALR